MPSKWINLTLKHAMQVSILLFSKKKYTHPGAKMLSGKCMGQILILLFETENIPSKIPWVKIKTSYYIA